MISCLSLATVPDPYDIIDDLPAHQRLSILSHFYTAESGKKSVEFYGLYSDYTHIIKLLVTSSEKNAKFYDFAFGLYGGLYELYEKDSAVVSEFYKNGLGTALGITSRQELGSS